jgi:molybdenum cofactor synthesis domain-containing protein
MRIELVTIGDELLLGFTVDTNGAEIARALSALGVEVTRRTAVPDRPEDIAAAVADALRRTGAMLTTGGLGPTRYGVSKKAIAELYGLPLQRATRAGARKRRAGMFSPWMAGGMPAWRSIAPALCEQL